MAAENWLFVGLGNPGAQYELTRHNVGQLVVGETVEKFGAALVNHKNIADVATFRMGVLPGGAPGPQIRMATLRCFMNVSGGPTKQLCQFFNVDPQHLVVIHDDLDLPENALRLKKGGGEGGHNGLKSISSALGTKDYLRFRIGIGRPPGRMNPADYVLARFKDLTQLGVTLNEATDVIESIVVKGFVAAQQDLHARQ